MLNCHIQNVEQGISSPMSRVSSFPRSKVGGGSARAQGHSGLGTAGCSAGVQGQGNDTARARRGAAKVMTSGRTGIDGNAGAVVVRRRWHGSRWWAQEVARSRIRHKPRGHNGDGDGENEGWGEIGSQGKEGPQLFAQISK